MNTTLKKSFLNSYTIFLFVVLSIGIVLSVIYSYRMQNYHDKTVEIRICDSVNIEVINTWRNHGLYYFNDSLYISSSKIEEPVSLYLYNLFYKFELPFYLKKNADNDTIWIIDNNETYFWVFSKDLDCKE